MTRINFEARSAVAHSYHPARAKATHRSAGAHWKGISPRLECCDLRGESCDSIEDPAIRPLVHLVDWVPFHERGNWYLDADLICFANQPGIENLLAWRTRVVDYLWTRTPLATNGGDPLSEEMIAAGAAVRVDATDPAALAATLAATLDSAAKLAAMRQAADAIREKYLWQNAIRPLAEVVRGTRVG